MQIKKLTIFCGSSPGAKPDYGQAAEELGRFLAKKGVTIVYGGGRVGMMGRLADAALQAGGTVMGVITQHLYNMEVGHTGTDLHVVDTMHERKAIMAEEGDGFLILPGGLGSLDEFFEAVTWSQLGLHKKPCGLLNVLGYFNTLISFLDHACQEQFMALSARKLIISGDDIEHLWKMMDSFSPSDSDKGRWARTLSQFKA